MLASGCLQKKCSLEFKIKTRFPQQKKITERHSHKTCAKIRDNHVNWTNKQELLTEVKKMAKTSLTKLRNVTTPHMCNDIWYLIAGVTITFNSQSLSCYTLRSSMHHPAHQPGLTAGWIFISISLMLPTSLPNNGIKPILKVDWKGYIMLTFTQRL